MTTPLTRALYRRSFDDGWLDVLVGLGLTLIGFAWLADQIVLGALVPLANCCARGPPMTSLPNRNRVMWLVQTAATVLTAPPQNVSKESTV